MSSKESSANYPPTETTVPIATPEIFTPTSEFPDTETFIHSFVPNKAQYLIPALSNPQLVNRLDVISDKLKSGKFEYGSYEFWSNVNMVTSDIFEIAGYLRTNEVLKDRNPNYLIASPYYTKMMYGIDDTNKRLCGNEWTEADLLVFERDGIDTYIAGAIEITGELNLGDPDSVDSISPHEFKQMRHYQNGQVIDDLFNFQSSTTRKKMGRFVQSLFPEAGLSHNLKFDPDRYFSGVVLLDENDVPPDGIDEIIRVPLSSNDSYFTALGLVHEATYGSETPDTPIQYPSPQPHIIPIRRAEYHTVLDVVAGD